MKSTRRLKNADLWRPLQRPVFRSLWFASLGSNLGTWMQNVGATWLMTTLSPSPLMIALVQVANYLPLFVLSVPAGAAADLIDRRRFLILTQTWMLATAAVTAGVAYLGWMTPSLLLFLTFLLNMGSAANNPPWQAGISDMVPKKELPSAVALGSLSFNLARAFGPALGGLLVAASGASAAFLLNSISYLGVLIVLVRWEHRRPGTHSLLRRGAVKRLNRAIHAGFIYVSRAKHLHFVFCRAFLFGFPASALWALLPVVARDHLESGAGTYGVLLGLLGVGGVLGAFVGNSLRERLTTNQLVSCMSGVFVLCLFILGVSNSMLALSFAMLAAGMAWLTLLSCLNTTVLLSVPEYIRARSLSIYLLILFGGLGSGSAVWGRAASHYGTSTAILASSFTLAIGMLGHFQFPIQSLSIKNLANDEVKVEAEMALEHEAEHA